MSIPDDLAKLFAAARLDDEIAPLLRELGADTPFGVVTGRLPAIGASADGAVASARARELGENPHYFADTGGKDQLITQSEMEKLRRYGAADGRSIQVIRAFRNERDMDQSKECRNCKRWIWLGATERQATCECGQTYRVVFDLPKVLRRPAPPGRRCMDCGVRAEQGTTDWFELNPWQARCSTCRDEQHVFEVFPDYETGAHAGAIGTFQIIELRELTADGERDVTFPYDVGIHFRGADEVEAHIRRQTGYRDVIVEGVDRVDRATEEMN
ncbi:MAG TPA: hypothetical protein VK540_13970 [Polyangiaceae bacterium]|nr:hypothetical protein [Polyangiaceae bacterium]